MTLYIVILSIGSSLSEGSMLNKNFTPNSPSHNQLEPLAPKLIKSSVGQTESGLGSNNELA